MEIDQVVMFGYRTRGEALEVAKIAVEDMIVAAVHVGFPQVDEDPTCFLVLTKNYRFQ